MPFRDYPKRGTLKDGTEVELRPLRADDGARLLRFFRSLPEDDRLFLKEDVTRQEVVDGYLANMDFTRVLPILAVGGDDVLGDGTLHMTEHGWTRHVGEIRLVVARQMQGRGLGTLIAHELVLHAQRMGLDKIQAQVVADAEGAVRMFEKLGFTQEAVLKGYVIDLRGQRHDLAIMVNDVAELWRQMEDMIQDSHTPEYRSGLPYIG